MQDDTSNSSYFDGRRHVRLRPGMYFGTDIHDVFAVLMENGVNQITQGNADTVRIALQDGNTISIEDNGIGIPTHIYQDTSKSVLEIILTEPGGKHYDSRTGSFWGGMFGVGLAAVNAVSERLVVEVKRDGFLWTQRYSQGFPQTEFTRLRSLMDGERSGTKVILSPDFSILEANNFSYERLFRRLRELAFLTRAIFVLEDQRSQPEGQTAKFHFPNGLVDFLAHLNRDAQILHNPIRINKTVEIMVGHDRSIQVMVDAAFQYTDSDSSLLISYVNTKETCDYSSQLEGLIQGLEFGIDDYANESGLLNQYRRNFTADDLSKGLTAVVHLLHPDPTHGYGIGRRYRYEDDKVRDIVRDEIWNAFSQFAGTASDQARTIVERCIAHKNTRELRRFGK